MVSKNKSRGILILCVAGLGISLIVLTSRQDPALPVSSPTLEKLPVKHIVDEGDVLWVLDSPEPEEVLRAKLEQELGSSVAWRTDASSFIVIDSPSGQVPTIHLYEDATEKTGFNSFAVNYDAVHLDGLIGENKSRTRIVLTVNKPQEQSVLERIRNLIGL